jgi:predicted TIM-barrel fold metal-dependent hydrolase
MTAIIDSDQHLYETRSCWLDHIDPGLRDEALRIEDDERGYPWIKWRDRRLGMADVQVPGETVPLGERRRAWRDGEPPSYSYDEKLPADYWDPSARRERVVAMGLDAAVLFPNFGLLWERRLSESLPAMLANMAAWNRWTAIVAAEGDGVLYPVAHVSLRDLDWLDAQLGELSSAGVRMAMTAPALVDGKPLSHPDHERAWSAFVEHGVTPVFHVADQPRVFDDAWYTDDDEEEALVNVVESAFLWTPVALACTDLIVNGTLDRHPHLRLGIVELSSIWVPQFLMMLDGGYEFVAKLNGKVPAPLSAKPSDYFRRQVRVSSFSYELPERLTRHAGDLFMFCSDYPHSEGSATPVEDYAEKHCDPDSLPGLYAGNVEELLGSAAA